MSRAKRPFSSLLILLSLVLATPSLMMTGCVSSRATPSPVPVSLRPTMGVATALPSAPRPPDHHRETVALTDELRRMWTRDPGQLVEVISSAREPMGDSTPLTFLLAIAHAETSGLVLDVSEAGAVGLAQTTPVAYLTEHFDGPLYISADYVNGARAYMLKKPLHDADVIASIVLDEGDDARADAARLFQSALDLRTEGVHELDYLVPFAGGDFMERVEEENDRNLRVLEELQRLLKDGDRKSLLKFRDRVHGQYKRERAFQQAVWRRYELDLAARRDDLLRRHFGVDPEIVKKTRAYEAGELLGRELDDRFSPTHMACFLDQHLRTKREEARRLGASSSELEGWTAALYNGGSHNVKRMMAGLISTLPETQNYMRKVPATRRKLDSALALMGMLDTIPGGAANETPRLNHANRQP